MAAAPPRFRYAQSSICTPFTIASSIKSFDDMNNSMDLNPPASFHETAAPMSNFQNQDNHVLMSLKDQNGFPASSSSSSLDHTNTASFSFHQPGFIDDRTGDSTVEPLQTLKQIEVGHEQGVDQLQVQDVLQLGQ
ncbi:MYB family transcription factor [Musa troglodytarum]|uniref:MYB family transcription factor n=1 Tax=Musa troglodytarum TaxID=320322 RepID=A0A9E7HXQ0_9LILI|nr:MYB family transcription factor [Musa troglodytarum]